MLHGQGLLPLSIFFPHLVNALRHEAVHTLCELGNLLVTLNQLLAVVLGIVRVLISLLVQLPAIIVVSTTAACAAGGALPTSYCAD